MATFQYSAEDKAIISNFVQNASTNENHWLPVDSAFSLYFNVFNPNSIIYTNAISEFGITVGLLKFIISGLLSTFVCVFGVVGNLISFLVLSSPQMGNTSTSLFLRCLAISDTITIACFTLVAGVPSLLIFNPDGGKSPDSTWLVFNKWIVKYSHVTPIVFIFQTGIYGAMNTVLFTMALTMDRYLAVCKPLLTLKYRLGSIKRARIVSGFLFSASLLYILPRYWEFDYLRVETKFEKLAVYLPVPTNLKRNFYYDALYTHMSYVIMWFLAPLVYLIVLNILIYRKIRQSRKFREASNSTLDKSDNYLSYMLFGIVIAIILCQVVPACHALFRYATGDVGTDAYVPEVECLMLFFVCLNSSVNFLIYCMSGSKYRNALVSVISCSK